jgi:hypothetical protein
MQRLSCDSGPALPSRGGWLTATQGRRPAHSRAAQHPRAAAGGPAPSADCLWRAATVVENVPACADGSLRTLTLSVSDEWKEVQLRRGTLFVS